MKKLTKPKITKLATAPKTRLVSAKPEPAQEKAAQCCAKNSRLVAGCHD
jgi:hypothetical protein